MIMHLRDSLSPLKILLATGASVLLGGCAAPSIHDFADDLPQPRPIAANVSEASKILYTRMPQYRDRKNPKLAVDTACWEDEPCTNGGFDPEKIRDLLHFGQRHNKLHEAKKEILRKYGTMPHPFVPNATATNGRLPASESAVNSVSDAFLFSGSVGDIGLTQRGASGFSDLGIGIGVAELLLSTDWGISSYMDVSLRERKLYEQRNIAFVLPESEQDAFRAAMTKSHWRARELAAQHLLKRMAGILADKGFKTKGRYWYVKATLSDDWYVYQALSNPAIGCPEPKGLEDKSDNSGDICRIECFLGETTMYFDLSTGVFRIGIAGNEFPTYTTTGFGTPYRFIANKDAEPHRKAINDYLFDELIRRYDDVVLYNPARQLPDGSWEPQHVIDRNGKHYFVVKVPRNSQGRAPASSSAP